MSFRFLNFPKLLVFLALLGSQITAQEEEKPSGLYSFVDFLYWNPSEMVDWAATSEIKGNSHKIAYKTLSFDWDPGFRVGLGYNMRHDQWDTRLYYTWFYTRATDHISTSPKIITPGFLANRTASGGTYHSAKMSLQLRFNIFDWELGRCFAIGEKAALRPLIGLKGGWINQTIHSRWHRDELILGIPVSINSWENVKNDFQGIGPKLGVNGKWILGSSETQSFSLIGDCATSFLWGQWRIRDRFHDNANLTGTTKVKNRNFGAFVLEAFIGFGWDYHFSSGLYHFSAKLGYEIQDWFHQYQVFDNTTGTQSKDLILQGLTLDFRLDF